MITSPTLYRYKPLRHLLEMGPLSTGREYEERKGKEEYLYSAFIQRLVSTRSDMDHTVLPANDIMPAFHS